MDDDDESRVDIVGEAFEKHLQRVDAARRRSDADCWESLSGLVLTRSSPVFGRRDLMNIVGHLGSAPGFGPSRVEVALS